MDNSSLFRKKVVRKLSYCPKKNGSTRNSGHWFNKHNVCTHCGGKYEELVTTDPKADGKLIT